VGLNHRQITEKTSLTATKDVNNVLFIVYLVMIID